MGQTFSAKSHMGHHIKDTLYGGLL